jgi:nitrous oxidase accessory protein NosD
MHKSVAILIAATGLGLSALPASAQATRTWVSGVGSDANPCSRTAPCSTFSGAISKTAAGGEIDCLDPGGFGAVTITKAITIDCNGVAGGILASGVNGVIVNAGVNDRIVLRNLSIQGVGTGINAIRFLAGLHLTVENVRISGFTTIGIDVSKSASGNLYVRDTYITNVPKGIRLFTGAGGINAQVDNSRFDSLSTSALEVASGSTVASISDSVVMNSGTALITTGGGFINADNNIIAKNTTGVNASVAASSIRITRNAFQDNGTAVTFAGGGTVSTAANNTVIGPPGLVPNGGAIPPL